MRLVTLVLLTASLLCGETFKLYLRDGSYHIATQYQVQGDRVRYYDTEQDDWEEIPLSLVDLGKTEKQRQAKLDRNQREAREADEEEAAERALRHQIESIPMNAGAYCEEGNQIKALAVAEYKVITDKKRQALKILSPIPIIPGKASVVIQGDHAKFIVHDPRPEFFLRLAKEERFGIIKLTPKKNARIVENISIIPVANSDIEEQKQVETFQQELAAGLYKVWPEKPLTAGEYALVEYTEGEVQLMVWDFAYDGSGSS